MKQFCSFYIIMFAVFNTINATGQTVTDIDGNVYNTVEIGTQQWMAENLKVTKYNEGTAIPLVTDGIGWNNLTTPGYCWYNNDNTTYGDVYGALYNWYGVNAGNFCPVGWHVPSDPEWTVLNDYLGGSSVAGGKLKASILWNSPNTGATDEAGFTALPGGYRGGDGIYSDIGNMGMWWSASGTGFPFDAWLRGMNYNNANFDRGTLAKYYGFSIRCVNDDPVGMEDRNNSLFEFNIYPNPSHKKVVIECTDSKEYLLQVIDIYGRIVIEKQISERTELEMESKGVYFVRLSDGSQISTKKLIIQ